MELPRARQILLTEAQGIFDVGCMALNQEFVYLGVKVLVVITGFAEVEAGHQAWTNSVMAAMKKLEKGVPYPVIVLASPLPRPYATRDQLRQLFDCSRQLQRLCKQNTRFEFTKSGLLFYGPGGLYANLMDQSGLTEQGVRLLRTQLIDKLNSLGVTSKR